MILGLLALAMMTSHGIVARLAFLQGRRTGHQDATKENTLQRLGGDVRDWEFVLVQDNTRVVGVAPDGDEFVCNWVRILSEPNGRWISASGEELSHSADRILSGRCKAFFALKAMGRRR